MANRIGNDDSSDDDFSDNLQLAERLRINRENKISHFHQKKNFLDDQSSSSSSLEMRPESHKDRPSRVYCSYNKKRQNGDKNAEQFANPKRTCLSNRFLRSPDYQHKKKPLPGHYPVSDVAHCSTDSATKHLFADKTYEDHFHNLADGENPAFNSSKEYSKKRIFNNLSEQRRPVEDVNYVPPKIPECQKQKNNEKEMKKERAEADSPKQFRWKQPLCHNGEHSRSADNGTMRPVPYRPPHLPGFYQSSLPSASERNIVHYVDSASDEDSRPVLKNGSLKGGRQSPDMSQNHKKVLGRKIKKKVLDSDDTDDDWPTININRSHPALVFSSSDSDEEEIEAIRKGGLKSLIPPEELANHPLSTREEDHSNRELFHNQGEAFQACFAKGGFAQPSPSPTVVYHSKSPSSRSCRTRKQSRNNAPPELSPACFHPNRSGGSAVRGRNRVNVGERLSRRSGSPHPRTLPSSHTRMTRAVVSKTTRGRSLTGSHSRRANLNLATTYPDLFDAEDSSEVEFFTANSYSDTETSAESFGGLRISTTVRNPENNGVICEHSINVGSSEDEISVVFSTGPSSGHLRRENQIVRNGDFRNRTPRTLGRRNNKRRSPHQPRESFREIVSLSPDPVEQVQQVEDDERFARMLQAQFDAEVDPDFDPSVRQPPTASQHFVYELPNTPESIDTDLADSDNEFDLSLSHPSLDNGFSTSHPPHVHFTALQSTRHRGYRSSRFPIRPTTPNFFGSIFYNNRRVDRNRRRPATNEARRLSTLANLFEANLIGDILSSDDSFETFLGLAELNGDVPRGLQKSEINRLPTRQYVAANGAGSSTDLPHKRAGLNKECQVCLSDYENGDILRILPCFHEFHTPCIDPWLKINHTCPVCRVVVDLGG